MHEHDQDLIVALASGDLPAVEARAARAEISSCARCLRDLDSQETVRHLLQELPAAALTETERLRLHRTLDLEAGIPTPQEEARPRVPWYQRLTPALGAAAIFLLVAGVGLAALLGGGVTTELTEPSDAPAVREAPTAGQDAPAATESLTDAESVSEDQLAAQAPAAPSEAQRSFGTASGFMDFGELTHDELLDLLADLSSGAVVADAAPGAQHLEAGVLCDGALADAFEEAEPTTFELLGTALVDEEQVAIYTLPSETWAAVTTQDCEVVAVFVR